MDLVNSFETVVHFLLIEMMTYLGHRDEFSILNTLVYITIHWIRPMVNHDISYQAIMIHQTITLHEFLTLREY